MRLPFDNAQHIADHWCTDRASAPDFQATLDRLNAFLVHTSGTPGQHRNLLASSRSGGYFDNTQISIRVSGDNAVMVAETSTQRRVA